MKKTYKVKVTRTTYDSMSFDVEANNERGAYDNAIEIAMDALWGSGNAEYEVETLEEVEEDEK
jgi:hypothetical protein